jgi:hypothetical protein
MKLIKEIAVKNKTKFKAVFKITEITIIMKTKIIIAKLNYLPHLQYSQETKHSLESINLLTIKK